MSYILFISLINMFVIESGPKYENNSAESCEGKIFFSEKQNSDWRKQIAL